MGKTDRIFSFPLLNPCTQIWNNLSDHRPGVSRQRHAVAACRHCKSQSTRIGPRKFIKTATVGDHAVVLGASMAGLLAARVLTDAYYRHWTRLGSMRSRPASTTPISPRRWRGAIPVDDPVGSASRSACVTAMSACAVSRLACW
jgi:hypothetical protein